MADDKIAIHEILEAVSKEPKTKKKINILKNTDCMALRIILQGAFDKNIKWLIPPGTPPNFKADDAPKGLQLSSIHKECLNFYMFVQAGVTSGKCQLQQHKREQIFVQMLECLHKDEAKMLIEMKDQRFAYKGLTPHLINEAFPGLIPEEGNWT